MATPRAHKGGRGFSVGEASTPTVAEIATVQTWEKPIVENTTSVVSENATTESTPVVSNIFFTSYNPEVGQTDSTPCIAGGTGLDVCQMAKDGSRPIALSQELITWSMWGKNGPFNAGDVVELRSNDYPDDPRCNGIFIVADAMNARFRSRGDIFFLDRADNLSCHADIFKVL